MSAAEPQGESGGGQNPVATRYGDYEIVKPIGKGKFAVVYRAKRVTNGEIVALKRISVDTIDEKAREKTLKEVGLLQSLDHPNVIRYMDSFITDNDLVIVFEWAAAGDLKRQLRKAQERGVGFEERVIWKYFSQICDAIAHMHERRIMHRDLKPANIFLTLDGTVKVGDLGLSRELSENTIQAHSKVGTPLYMSPEVLKGDGYDFKSDVWSLGCILYELAMLKSPFKAEGLNLYSLFQKISQGDFVPLPENYSEDLRELSYVMISTKPEDRPEMEHNCDVARRMRALYNEKNNAAKSKKSEKSSSSSSAGAEAKDAPQNQMQGHNQDQGGRGEEKHLRDSDRDRDRDSERDGQRHGEREEEYARAEEKQQPWEGRLPSSNYDSAKQQEPDTGAGDERERGGGGEGDNNGYASSNGTQGKGREKQWGTEEDDGYAPSNSTGGAADWNTASSSAKNGNNNNHERDERERDEYGSGGYRSNQSDRAAAGGDWAAQLSQQPSSNSNSNHNGNSSSSSSKSRFNYDSLQQDYKDDDQGNTQVQKSNAPQVTRRVKPQPTTSTSPPKQSIRSPQNVLQQVDGEGRGGISDRDRDRVMLKDSYVAFALSEAAYSKLMVLGYPPEGVDVQRGRKAPDGKGRLLPMHFAVDLSALGSVAGYGRERQFFQFRRMVEVCVWLCNLVGGRAASLVATVEVDHDAPLMVAKQLLGAAQAAGVSDDVLSGVLPTALSVGHGEKVCEFINSLGDAVQRAVGLQAKTLKYEKGDKDAGAGFEENDDGADEVGVVEEEGGGAVEEEIEDNNNNLASPSKGGFDSDRQEEEAWQSMGSPSRVNKAEMIQSEIDPALWREEVERVANVLARAKTRDSASSSWGGRLDALRTFSETVQAKNWTEGGSKGKNHSQVNNAMSLVDIQQSLGGLQRYMATELEGIRRAENFLNVKDSLISVTGQFGTFKKEIKDLEERIAGRSSAISELTDKLSGVEEQMEGAADRLETQSGGDGSEGASQSTKLRAAIKKIKEEVVEMNLTCGMLEALLLSKRSLHAKHSAKKNRTTGNRHQKKKKGQTSNENEDDDVGY